MISNTLKKGLSLFKSNPITEQIDFASKKSIPIRHLAIGFEGKQVDLSFYMNNQFATLFFATLSVFLTYGEDLVIETARHHRDLLKDPILRQRVTSLIGQEAIHSKLHNEFNDAIVELDYPVKLYRFLGEKFFDHIFLKFPQPLKLSLMAGIEHFTAVLAEYMMAHEQNFYFSDDAKTRALWMWHMLEESEHKDIAYDVFQALSNNYALRIAGFFPALITILILISVASLMVPFYREPKNLIRWSYWKELPYSFSLIFGLKDGVYGSTMQHIFDYLRPDFHPNDHDTSAYLSYYKEKLLNPEHGILTPYFTREYTPSLRS